MGDPKTILLNSGHRMPLLGLGCWQSPIDVVESAVETALDEGYRHIDTAYMYRNEKGVGNGIKKWLKKTGKNRSDIFVVTKLPMIGMHKGGIEICLKKSLEDLQLDYVDLYLVHCPVGLKGSSWSDIMPMDDQGKTIIDDGTDLIAVWKEMETMVDKGLAKSIGISNFSIKQMRKIIANARIPPAVQQVEMHVKFQQSAMMEFCKSKNIIITAYAPFGSPGRVSRITGLPVPNLLEHPVVTLVSERHGVTTGQILLRFLVQQNVIVIPKSVNPQRIKKNGEIWSFTLSELEMSALKTLDQGDDGRTFGALPGFEDHPEFQF